MSQTPPPSADAYAYDPRVRLQSVVWPPPEGYPWKKYVSFTWAREGLLRKVGPKRLLCTWTTGGFCEPTSGNFAMIAISDDDGATWRDAGRFEHPTRGLFVTELFQESETVVHAFLQTYDSGRWFSANEMFRSVSRDGGETWEPPRSIPGGTPAGWANIGIRHSGGRWIVPLTWPEHVGPEWGAPVVGRASGEAWAGTERLPLLEMPRETESWIVYMETNAWCHRNHRYVAGALLSDDGGKTFRLRGYIEGGKENHLLEPQVVELRDGSVAMLLRSMSEGVLLKSLSRDGGETWSAPERTEIPNPSAKVNVLRHSDGRIFLLHNPNGSTENKMEARTPLSLWVSDDDMKTWRVKADLVVSRNGKGLNYPSGFLDEAGNRLRFVWEDAHSLFLCEVPLDIA
ncbi:MAG TPA: sialidase family protein [Candidatus Methylacidiphilales bacterium]